LACLLAGGYLIRATATTPSAGPDSIGGATKTGERDARLPLAGQGEALAKQAVADSKASPFDATEAGTVAKRLAPGEGEKMVRNLTAAGTLEPPAGAEFAGALLAWFRENPEAVLRFIEEAGMNGIYAAVLEQALAELSPADHWKLASGLPERSKVADRIAEVLGKRLSELSTEEAAEVVAAIQLDATSPRLLRSILYGWPADNAASFLDLALATNDVSLLQAYLTGGGSPRKSSALMVLLEGRDDLPQEFADFLAKSAELKGHLYRYANPSVPLDERVAQMRNLAWLKDATPEALREGALKQISTVDINELMKSGPDYRYAFRHGAMSAEEVLAAVRQQFPELAAASDYETRVRVFNELASEDAQAAYALIAHLPGEQRNLAVLHQSRWSFRDNSPDSFYAMIGLAPGPDSAEAAPQRAEAWTVYGQSAYAEYGSDYLDWVRELPPGVNRDVARSTLAQVLRRQKQPALADEFSKP